VKLTGASVWFASACATLALVLPSRARVVYRPLVLVILVLPVYLLRLDRVCGLFSDDAWYVLLAKALATGHGYTVINAPHPGAVPMYPPGLPLVLSLVFLVAPSFPANVLLLKVVSVLAMAGVAVLAFVHAREVQRLPLVVVWTIALATGLHPAFVFLATSTVMSECLFTFLQLAGVIATERALCATGCRGRAAAFGSGMLASFAYLTRSMGLALVAAGLVRLAGGWRWRTAVVFALGVAAIAVPWHLYAHAHAPTPAMQAEENDGVMYSYATHFWMNVAGHPGYGTASVRDLPLRVVGQLWAVARSSMGALHVYSPFRSVEPAAWGAAPAWAHGLALVACALALVGFMAALRTRVTTAELLVPLSLGMTLLWPFSPTRLVLPLLPFLLCYTARGVAMVGRLVLRRDTPALAAIVLGALAVVSATTDAAYVAALHGPPAERPRWNRIFDEELDLASWLRAHVSSDAVVAASQPALVHLYTGLRSVGVWQEREAEWRALDIHVFADTEYLGRDPRLLRFPVLYRTPVFGMRVLDLTPLYSGARAR
jgi:hypothetical protein